MKTVSARRLRSAPGQPESLGAEPAVPILVDDLHLDKPLPDVNGDGRFEGARLLAWLHDRPIAEVTLDLQRRPLAADELTTRIWPLLAEHVARHCEDDGIPSPGSLPVGGIVRPPQLACAEGRRVAVPGPPMTVVIATRNRPESLLRCLASLTRMDYPDFDVVVVDSAPDTAETEMALARQSAWPFRLRYLRVLQPGLALAHNAALPEITGEIVAITDDDTEAQPDWLTVLAHAFAEYDATCVTGLILPAELETSAQQMVEDAWGFGRGFTRRIFRLDMPDPDPVFPFSAGRFGSGANMAFRTDWLVSRGGFDPATGTGTPARGGDDLVAFLKVIADGRTLVYEPAAIVRHWHRREGEGLRRQAFSYGLGFGAYFAASVAARPGLAVQMLGRVLPVVGHHLTSRSARSVARQARVPLSLRWRERAGLLVGPAAYARSRWTVRARLRQGIG